LFTIYLEGVLRKFRHVANYTTTAETMDTCYADDVDFINTTKEANEANLRILEEELPQSGLLINGGKTEFIDIHTRSHPNVRKLGSRIDSDNDIMNRISAGNVAFKKLRELWRRKKHVITNTKLSLYNSTIVTILTYNLGSNAAHAKAIHKMDTTHRKHLRQILNIYYPNKISNKDLYARCNTTPMSQQIRSIRWQLFGHILRLPLNTPPQLLMDNYMKEAATKKCKIGGQHWTLPRLLNKEIRVIGRTFMNAEDLQEMRTTAANREGWIAMRKQIEEKWTRKEKVNQAKRKLVILLTPTRTPTSQEEEIRVSPQQINIENDEDQEESQSKKQRLVLRIAKRKVEAVMQIENEDEEIETVTLWKRHRAQQQEEAPPNNQVRIIIR
jgi:hypothetical protein